MKGALKVGAFLVVLAALLGGGWYVSQNSHNSGSGDSNFNKALEIMKSLQSSALGSSLTSDQLDILEQGFIDAQVRLPKITSFRDADQTALITTLNNNGVTGTGANDLQTRIVNLARGRVDEYTAGIDTLLNALPTGAATPTVKSQIQKLAGSVNSLSNDIRLTTQFISWYTAKRPNICLSTDPTNNQYIKGVITFKYDTARTAVTESCSGSTLTEHFCSGLEYIADAAHDKTRTCEFGCNDGACLKGTLGTVSVVNGNTSTATAMTDVKANQPFWLKTTATRLHTATATSNTTGTSASVVSSGMGYTTAPTVTVTGGTCTTRPTARAIVVDGYVTDVKLIGAVNCSAAPTISIAPPPATTGSGAPMKVQLASPSLTNSKCTYTGDSQYLNTGSTDVYFGPITCSAVESHTFSLNLLDGSITTPVAVATKTVGIGGVSMGNFTITTANDKVAAGNEFSITVKAIGTNGFPYVGYTGDFFVIVDGDDGATFPQGAQRIPAGQSELTIPGIKFSNAGAIGSNGTIKITIRGENVAETAEKVFTVTAADLGIRKDNGEYVKDITLNSGDKFNYKWTATNGTTASSSFTCTRANGAACTGVASWVANTLSGQYPTTGSSTLTDANKGITYTITYKVKKTGVTGEATDTIVFRINE